MNDQRESKSAEFWLSNQSVGTLRISEDSLTVPLATNRNSIAEGLTSSQRGLKKGLLFTVSSPTAVKLVRSVTGSLPNPQPSLVRPRVADAVQCSLQCSERPWTHTARPFFICCAVEQFALLSDDKQTSSRSGPSPGCDQTGNVSADASANAEGDVHKSAVRLLDTGVIIRTSLREKPRYSRKRCPPSQN
jgi:hypothetical protein